MNKIKETSGSVASILLKIAAQAVIGQFTYTKFPLPVVVLALLLVIFLFFISLYKKDYFSFLMQLFICNHYTYGYEIGGTFNLAATIALVAYLLNYGSSYFAETSLKKPILLLTVIFLFIQCCSLIYSRTPTSLKISSAACLFNFFFLFYYASKIQLDADKYIKIIQVTGIYFCFMFVNALNQRYEYFLSPFDFFPNVGPNATWELDIPRAAGTLGNFEYYAEYSISLIALCLPGVLSGSYSKVSKKFMFFCIGLLGLALLAIVLSGTRSSILLLPFLVILTIFLLAKRTSFKNLAIGAAGVTLFFIINSIHTIVDFSIFTKRSEEVDMKHVTLESVMSGKDMNRGEIFAYGFEKMQKANLFLGEGFFTNRNQYVITHFDKIDPNGIPDYHNLYMSAVVLWGYLGALILIFFFFFSLYRGFRLYFKLKKQDFFLVDLLLGFNLLFLFFMVNQFKIQFIRDANYFMLTLILLAFYNSLIHLLSKKVVVIPTQQIKFYENSSTTHNL
ncbi:O-antigen ligase family protein [Pedobacter endophyticus]|uniref:O-antigen ligase family protein n=1 Tax=Pedobacter endophyticus TaxID=2789740 RepID=A0A7S9PZQ2_9SPHI|nr:O-antigen ligase family protein [Pedobacter endophyticus]QPH39936.1 O-antigen ligase family protein [Pedobacter endophyticus]